MAPRVTSGRKKKKKHAVTLGAENTSTADLEAIVFGKSFQLLQEGSAADNEIEDTIEDDDVEDGLLAAGDREKASPKIESQSITKKPLRRKKKRKRPEKAANAEVHAGMDDLDEDSAGGKKAAWVDSDDATLQIDLNLRNRTRKLRRSDAEGAVAGDEYESRLREQFQKLHGTVSWAERRLDDGLDPGRSSGSDDEDELRTSELPATSATPIVNSSNHSLMPHRLEIKCRHRVEVAPPSSSQRAAVVQSLHFHPDSELMLTAGLDKTLRIFGVDGTDNTKIASYFFKDFPIMGAKFTPNGDQVLLTGRDHKMWGLDVRTGQPLSLARLNAQHLHAKARYRGLTVGPCPADSPALRSNQMYAVLGDSGQIVLCDVPSKQPVRTLRMSVPGVAAVFSAEKDVIFSADQDNNLYEWDLATGRCMQRVKAAWATGIESLALRRVTAHAPTPLLAVGTVSGNIDLYDTGGPKILEKPTATIGHLTTMVTALKFNPTGEVLLGASKFKKDSLKLMHCATATVFQNWPTTKTPLNRVTSVDFSREGGMLAMANEQGKILLYQLTHYGK